MQNEDTLITSCARTVVSPAFAQNIQWLLENNLDWEYVQRASLLHGVLPLVFKSLSAVGPESLPDKFLSEAKSHCRSTAIRNLHMTAGLLKVLRSFKENGIIAVPFKGPVFAETVYGNVGLRNFGDLDILVWPHDANNAFAILQYLEFQQAIDLSPSQLSSYMKTEDDMVFTHRADGLTVELHWELSGRYLSTPLDMEHVSKGLETVSLLNTDVQQLSSEDMLLYLCIHGTRHMWERLEWVCCIAELIQNKPSLDWDMVFNLAEKLSCTRVLCHGLSLANEILEATLPKSVTERLTQDPILPYLTQKVTDHLFPLSRSGQSAATGYRFKKLQFQVRDSKFDQVRYGWRQLVAPREADWRWLPLPSHLTFLYSILRPCRLFYKFVSDCKTSRLWK